MRAATTDAVGEERGMIKFRSAHAAAVKRPLMNVWSVSFVASNISPDIVASLSIDFSTNTHFGPITSAFVFSASSANTS